MAEDVTAEPSELSPFARAHRWEKRDDGLWHGEITEGWLQGRAAFGGLQAAVAMRAFQTLVDPERIPRTLTVHFAGPLMAGPATFEGKLEREGGNVSHTSGRILQDGQPVALALATFGRARDHWFSRTGEAAPDFREPKALRMPSGPGIPAFTQYVNMDLVDGFPYSRSEHARVRGWTRFLGNDPIDAAMLCALGDVWPPAAVACMKTPRPSSSVDLSYHFLAPPPLEDLAPDSFFAFDAESTVARDGYAEERGSMWARDGRLVLRIRQLRAVY